MVDVSRRLSPRELEILELAAQGLSVKTTAVKLGTSPHTVHAQRRAILAKTDSRTIAEATFKLGASRP